jgi:hypothetical protein
VNNKQILDSKSESNPTTVWKLPSSGSAAHTGAASSAAAAGSASSAAAASTPDSSRGESITIIEFDHVTLEVWIDGCTLSIDNGELAADFMDGA